MSDYAEIIAIVEGATERNFAEQILVPYLAYRSVYLTPIIISKPGEKGGDVKFDRARNDIEHHLKQRQDTYLTFILDFYGMKEWPGLTEARKQSTPQQKAQTINDATRTEVLRLFPGYNAENRLIPYIAMHETEALLFSDPQILAAELDVKAKEVEKILLECKAPENINDSNITAPSKRLENLSTRFKKTTTGVTIAKEIGLTKMRSECPLFNEWLSKIENLGAVGYGEN